jgi:septum formation protein
MLNNKKVILASSSPRRKALMQLLDLEFDIIKPDIDEILDDSLTYEDAITTLAYQKAQAIYKSHPDAIVLGFDTLVYVDNEILAKPINEDDVRRMLRLLSGKSHRVITGCAIISEHKTIRFFKDALVSFKTMTEDEIEDYIKTNERFGKAGAYAIQGFGARYIHKIEGDYYAVMGLPIHDVYITLKDSF